MASVKDVAAHAGVSVGTVSNVLNGRATVADVYVKRVMEAIDELGFIPNEAARALRVGSSRVVGFIVSEEDNPFFTEVVRGAELAAEPSGGIVLVGHTRGEESREAFYLDAFADQRARGVILQPDRGSNADLQKLRSHEIPIVVLANIDPRLGVSSVVVDGRRGGNLATRHLVATGRQRLAFVGGTQEQAEIQQRVAGAREGAGSVSLEIIETSLTNIQHGQKIGEELAARAANERPDGIFAANDLVALGLLNAFTRSGLRVPDDVALVGFDDIALARDAHVPLTTVRQPSLQIGRTAIGMIENERNNGAAPTHVQLEPALVVRASSAARS